MTCPYCGAEQETDSIYCDNCELLLPAVADDAPLQNTANHPFRFWLLFLLVPIALLVGIAIFAAQHPTQTTQTGEGQSTLSSQIKQQGNAALLCEDASRFSETEQETMLDTLAETSETLQMAVGVRIGATPLQQDTASKEAAIADYIATFSEEANGVWLYLDGTVTGNRDTAKDYLLTAGAAQLYYTNSPDCDRIAEIFAQMQPTLEATSIDGIQVIQQFCDALLQYYEEGILPEYYVYDADVEQYLYEQDGEIVWRTEPPPWVASETGATEESEG